MIPSSQFPSRFHAIAKIQNGCHWRDIWHILLVPSSQINLAILFMDKLEQIAFSSCRLVSPYKRYVDVIYLQTAKWREGKLIPRHHEQSTPETKIWDRETHCITRRPIFITTWLASPYHDERRELLWILQETCEKAAFRTPPVCPTKALKDQLHPQRTEAYTAEMFNPNNIQQTRPRLRQHSPPQRISRTHHTWNKTPAESPKRPPNTDKRVALSQNPVHLKPAKTKNHGNLQERKHPSANCPQVLHSETSPFTQNNRKEMQQTKLPQRRHQFMPTEKHRVSAHVQSLWRIFNRKHDTIPTWPNKRTLDQRQLVGKKHLTTRHRNNSHNIEVKVITRENDPVNLRLYEAYYIRKHKPGLNSREECTELNDLLF